MLTSHLFKAYIWRLFLQQK